jgi:membrane protease YdiL (CAAX protease family)
MAKRPSPLPVFLGVAFGGSILLSLAIGLSGGHKSSLIGLAPLTMLVPALGVLAARIAAGASLGIEWARLPWCWLPVALLLLPLAIHAVALPGVFLLEGRLPWVPGLAHGPGHLVINALSGLAIVSFLAFFEEIGWRAFMLPRLAERMGARRAAVGSALIWALWHVPFALSGILHVENVTPFALALVEPVGVFGAGLFLAFLWFKTESVLLVALAHGAFNNWGQYAFKFMKTSGERDFALLGLVVMATLAVGASALAQIANPRASTGRR